MDGTGILISKVYDTYKRITPEEEVTLSAFSKYSKVNLLLLISIEGWIKCDILLFGYIKTYVEFDMI